MCAWCGRRLPFSRLHGLHAVTTLRHTVRPPLERGTTWSNVRSCAEKSSPQYWQAKLSRRNTLNRVKAGRRSAGTYSFSAITLGRFIVRLGLRIGRSYSATTLTRSRNTALMASCQDHNDRGKYESGRKSAFNTSAGQVSGAGNIGRTPRDEPRVYRFARHGADSAIFNAKHNNWIPFADVRIDDFTPR
jgi:hypothetical protein